jgi:hypothetical protein
VTSPTEGDAREEPFAIDPGTGEFTPLTVDPSREVKSPPFRFRDEAAFFTTVDGRRSPEPPALLRHDRHDSTDVPVPRRHVQRRFR